MKQRVYNKREFNKLLITNGYKCIRTHGSHFIYKNKTETISVPLNLNRMICKRLIKEHNLCEVV